MARYRNVETNPRFLAVDLARQRRPGTFEHALNPLLYHAVDVSHFDARFRNDEAGALAYPPAMLLKVVLFASSQGIVSTLGADIARVFAAIVAICDSEGSIGSEMFAIDGVTLPSDASKQRSGTQAEFERQATRLEVATTVMVQRNRAMDARPIEPDLAAKAAQRVTRLERDATQLRDGLAAHPADRRRPTGGIRKSNRTDNESAKMATSKGVIQGYTGVAEVEARRQIVVEAQAHGTGFEQELLVPVVRALQPLLAPTPRCARERRTRDARFTTQALHHAAPDPLHDKSGAPTSASVYQADEFTSDATARTCVRSCTIRRARSRTSGENDDGLGRASTSQRMEPPAMSGRFSVRFGPSHRVPNARLP